MLNDVFQPLYEGLSLCDFDRRFVMRNSRRYKIFGCDDSQIIPHGPLHPMTYPEAYEHPELAG